MLTYQFECTCTQDQMEAAIEEFGSMLQEIAAARCVNTQLVESLWVTDSVKEVRWEIFEDGCTHGAVELHVYLDNTTKRTKWLQVGAPKNEYIDVYGLKTWMDYTMLPEMLEESARYRITHMNPFYTIGDSATAYKNSIIWCISHQLGDTFLPDTLQITVHDRPVRSKEFRRFEVVSVSGLKQFFGIANPVYFELMFDWMSGIAVTQLFDTAIDWVNTVIDNCGNAPKALLQNKGIYLGIQGAKSRDINFPEHDMFLVMDSTDKRFTSLRIDLERKGISTHPYNLFPTASSNN